VRIRHLDKTFRLSMIFQAPGGKQVALNAVVAWQCAFVKHALRQSQGVLKPIVFVKSPCFIIAFLVGFQIGFVAIHGCVSAVFKGGENEDEYVGRDVYLKMK